MSFQREYKGEGGLRSVGRPSARPSRGSNASRKAQLSGLGRTTRRRGTRSSDHNDADTIALLIEAGVFENCEELILDGNCLAGIKTLGSAC